MKRYVLFSACLGLLTIVATTFAVDDVKDGAANNEADRIGHIGAVLLPVYDVTLFSEALQRDMHINVVLPRGYAESNVSYPTLYLCHGFTSNYHEFTNIGVPEYLNRFDMIVVMVDVGNSSYVNWAQSDDGRPYKFADHVCHDVIGYVDEHYRTIASRKGRAINGISMGGLDCGYDDFLVKQSQEFAKLLMDNKIPFQFGQSDGKHEEDYWGREVSVSMAVQYAVMLRHIWGREFDVYDPYRR